MYSTRFNVLSTIGLLLHMFNLKSPSTPSYSPATYATLVESREIRYVVCVPSKGRAAVKGRRRDAKQSSSSPTDRNLHRFSFSLIVDCNVLKLIEDGRDGGISWYLVLGVGWE